MVNQIQIQSVLNEARWASRTLTGKDSEINVHLVTFPGVVGGVFRAQFDGLKQDHFGEVNVSIISTGIDLGHPSDEHSSASPITHFQEVESLSVQNFSFEVMFRIPFEAQGTEEGAVWNLTIHFANGTSEIFEVPVCRTTNSHPEITAVQIAAAGYESKQHQQKTSVENQFKPYTMTHSNGELNLRFPSRIPGRVSVLAKGLGIVAGLWAVMLAIIAWSSNGAFEPMFVFGLVLLIMLIAIVFMLFGVSYCKLNQDKLATTYKLFGLPIYWGNSSRSDVVGFSTLCLDPIQSPGKQQMNYVVTMMVKKSSKKFLCLTCFKQNEARMLAKQLNEFLGIGKS